VKKALRIQTAARLKEAVDAMRNLEGMPAAEWANRYKTFHEATKGGPLFPSGSNLWDRQLSAMNTELALRSAEFQLAWRRE
jgi:hypothetical protein